MFPIASPIEVSMASTAAQEAEGSKIDPIWTTSRTARQIYALGEVDKVNPIASIQGIY